MSMPADYLVEAENALVIPSLHRDSVREVYGSSDEEGDTRRWLIWFPGEIRLNPPNLLNTAERARLRMQLMQGAHFVFHRLKALPEFSTLRQVVVNGGVHTSNGDAFDHVHYDLRFLGGVLAIHVKFEWLNGMGDDVGHILWDTGYTTGPNDEPHPF